jgi:hypothetical protein
MTRRAVFLLVLALTLLIPAQAQAVGVWDPNDVQGPFDLRWVGATHTSTGRIKLTVTFYAGFSADKLPDREIFNPGVWVELDDYMTGFFWVNRRGDVVLSYGDTASGCCYHAPVAQPAPRTLVARYRPFDEGEPGFVIRGWSQWRLGENRVRDRTRAFDLAA